MEISFNVINSTGIITLNRPKALNALNLEMVELFTEKLNEWKKNNEVKRVLLQGEGKHFCAGGDVKSLVLNKNKNYLKEKFFKAEYKLNYLISKFPKQYLSIWNGFVMGGGVGLSIYGKYRLANDTSKLAMPETAIGFFPDVGASYFLSKIPKNYGKYLGLTGQVITVNEMLFLGIATHYCNLNDLNKFKDNYIKNGKIENYKFQVNSNSDLLLNLDYIEKTFKGDIFSIIKKLKKSNTEFSNYILETLKKKCPISLAITCELIQRSKNKSLKECLEMEFQLSQKIVYRNDFNNGVEAVLITKNHNPKWKPVSINEITKKDVNKLFEFHTEKLNFK